MKYALFVFSFIFAASALAGESLNSIANSAQFQIIYDAKIESPEMSADLFTNIALTSSIKLYNQDVFKFIWDEKTLERLCNKMGYAKGFDTRWSRLVQNSSLPIAMEVGPSLTYYPTDYSRFVIGDLGCIKN